MNFRRSRYASGAPGVRSVSAPPSFLAPDDLRSGARDGWHTLPCGGAVRFASGEAIKVSDLGAGPGRAPLKSLVYQAQRACGGNLRVIDGPSNTDGVLTWRVQ